MSEQDMPLTPRARGRLAYNMYIAGVNQFDLQKEREEILDVTQEDIQQFRKLIREILGTHNICVIGSDAAIEANKKLFNNIENLS